MGYIQKAARQSRENGKPFIMSLGPRTAEPIADIFMALCDVVAPMPEPPPEETLFETAVDEFGAADSDADEEGLGFRAAGEQSVFFLNVIEIAPSSLEVAEFAPKVTGSTSTAVARLPIMDVQKKKKAKVRVGIDDSDGTSFEDAYILGTSQFHRQDFAKCHVWESSLRRPDGIVYDISTPFS